MPLCLEEEQLIVVKEKRSKKRAGQFFKNGATKTDLENIC